MAQPGSGECDSPPGPIVRVPAFRAGSCPAKRDVCPPPSRDPSARRAWASSDPPGNSPGTPAGRVASGVAVSSAGADSDATTVVIVLDSDEEAETEVVIVLDSDEEAETQ